MKSLQYLTDIPYKLLTSFLIRAVHMGEISKLVQMTGFLKQATWVGSLLFPIPVAIFNLQNARFILQYPITLFIVM
jgi:hypothetical protein